MRVGEGFEFTDGEGVARAMVVDGGGSEMEVRNHSSVRELIFSRECSQSVGVGIVLSANPVNRDFDPLT